MTESAPLRLSDRPWRVHDAIARELGQRIVGGLVQPGSALSGEIEASEKFNISRTAYREAVRSLAAKGLVMPKPKVGTVVCAVERWHLLDPDVLSWAFAGDHPDPELLSNLFELRLLIEPEAAALAAQRRGPWHLEAMRDALDRMAKFTLTKEAGRQADQEFHATLLRASDNPFIVSLADGISAAVSAMTALDVRSRPEPPDPMPAHNAVFVAIAEENPIKARQFMTRLIRQAQQSTTGRSEAAVRIACG